MKLYKLAFALILLVLIHPVNCISLGISSGDGGSSSSVTLMSRGTLVKLVI